MGIHLQFQTGCSTQGCWWGSQGWGVTSVPGSSPQPCPQGHRGVLCACGWGGDLSHMDIRVRRMVLASPTCPGPAPKEQGGGFGVYLPTLLLSCPVGSGTLLWLFATSPVSHGFFGCWTRLRCAGCSVMRWGRLPSPWVCRIWPLWDWALLEAQIAELLADGGRMPLLLGSRA